MSETNTGKTKYKALPRQQNAGEDCVMTFLTWTLQQTLPEWSNQAA